MPRFALPVVMLCIALTASAQVRTLGDLSFAAPEGWNYEQKPGEDHATMISVAAPNFCAIVIYSPRPASGDAEADFKAAWSQIVLGPSYRGMPTPIYDIRNSVGYPGKQTGDNAVDGKSYTWMYLLETGSASIPVVVVNSGRNMFDGLQHVLIAFIGSVRVAPLRAQPVKTSISVADLAGNWTHGEASSVDYVNSAGQYAGNSTVFYGEGYNIGPDGHFTYQFTGRSNGRDVRDKDSGVVEFSGDLVVFKGAAHTHRYHFINAQQALNGATVMVLLGEGNDPTGSNISMYGERWVRKPAQGASSRK